MERRTLKEAYKRICKRELKEGFFFTGVSAMISATGFYYAIEMYNNAELTNYLILSSSIGATGLIATLFGIRGLRRSKKNLKEGIKTINNIEKILKEESNKKQ